MISLFYFQCMKTAIPFLLLVFFLAGSAYAQVSFTIENQPVDNSQVQYVHLDMGQYQGFQTDVLNQSADTMYVFSWVCMLQDDPNLEMKDHQWGNPDNPLSGIHANVNFDTATCWPGAFWTDDAVAPGERFRMFTNFDVNGNGCERFRYLIFDSEALIDSITIEVCSTLGLQETLTDALAVSPNPTSGVFTISSGLPVSEVRIMNLQGQHISFEEVKVTSYISEIRTINTPEGCYFVAVEFENGTIALEKLVVH